MNTRNSQIPSCFIKIQPEKRKANLDKKKASKHKTAIVPLAIVIGCGRLRSISATWSIFMVKTMAKSMSFGASRWLQINLILLSSGKLLLKAIPTQLALPGLPPTLSAHFQFAILSIVPAIKRLYHYDIIVVCQWFDSNLLGNMINGERFASGYPRRP